MCKSALLKQGTFSAVDTPATPKRDAFEKGLPRSPMLSPASIFLIDPVWFELQR